MNDDGTEDALTSLNSINRELKLSYPIDSRKVVIRRQYGMTQVCINTRGCSYGMNGSCLFCNYPRGNPLNPDDIDGIMKEVVSATLPGDRTILIGTCGSILDQNEVSTESFERILNGLAHLKGFNIIFETRLETIDEDTLRLIGERLHDNRIRIEFGLESSDPFILKYCLNKRIDLEMVRNGIRTIHSHGFAVTANVIVGAPFLAPGEQLLDALESIGWALSNDIDDVVIFPINIRRGTVLERVHDAGLYTCIDHKMMVSTLAGVDPRNLDRISISWADPNEVDDDTILIHPSAAEPNVYEFYKAFMKESSSTGRRRILEEFMAEMTPMSPAVSIDYDTVKERVIRASETLKNYEKHD